MINTLKKYCNDEPSTGLMLLDLATGVGKTWSVNRYIFEAMQDPTFKKRIFFLTSLKKNLPEEELREMFEQTDQRMLFENKFLRVESNYEGVLKGLTAEVERIIPADIKKTEEYRALKLYVESVRYYRSQPTAQNKPLLKQAEEELRGRVEKAFRSLIQAKLKAECSTVEERREAIKSGAWQWVQALYPAVLMEERQIIFMSMDKFLLPQSAIADSGTVLYRSSLIKDAIIFIDEFDATKDTMLRALIRESLNNKVDELALFRRIDSALRTHHFPTILTTPSQHQLAGKYGEQSLDVILETLRKIAAQISAQYTLAFNHKTVQVIDRDRDNFLFQDHRYHSILSGNNQYITCTTNQMSCLNMIDFSKEKPMCENNNIQTMLGRLRGFISYFSTAVRILATNYYHNKCERHLPNDDEFTYEKAVRTVLAEFDLDSATINLLANSILMGSRRSLEDGKTEAFDMTYYERGFRYYDFEDDVNHDLISKIMMISMALTPEKLLLRMCESAKVVGISATATLPSVVGNYDLNYLKEKLRDRFVFVSKADRACLDAIFETSIRGYDQINIHTALIDGEDCSEAAWRKVVDHEEKAGILCAKVDEAVGGNMKGEKETHYLKARYLRIAIAFKEFLSHEDIHSFLCILTKHPRHGDRFLNLDVLLDLFKVIVDHHKQSFDVDKSVVQLDGEHFDENKEKYLQQLSQGNRLFVISVYQTIGAGQNLQYTAPMALKNGLVKTNNRASTGKKDFDAIYLDKPTNLLTLLSKDVDEEDFVKFISQIEMLQENAEISMQEAAIQIKRAFRTWRGNSPDENVRFNAESNTDFKKIYQTPSVAAVATRVLIQAVGRLCRTNLKNPDIYIYADARILNVFDFDALEGRQLNPEFRALASMLYEVKSTLPDEEDVSLRNKAALTSCRVNKYIHSIMRDEWTEHKIKQWQMLREWVLCHPTLSVEDFDKLGVAYNFYIELPQESDRVYYAQSGDYDEVAVSWTKCAGMQEESAAASRLKALMEVDFLRDAFESRGWATTFVANRYIMAPPLFNNIYRGALGEVVGALLFERFANVTLEEITDVTLFEKFDFKVRDKDIYVDFKNWHESTYMPSEQTIAHIVEKAQRCRAKCVIIANIVAENTWEVRVQNHNDVRVVIVPALLSAENLQAVPKAWREIMGVIHNVR